MIALDDKAFIPITVAVSIAYTMLIYLPIKREAKKTIPLEYDKS